jgi:hypothetical protein
MSDFRGFPRYFRNPVWTRSVVVPMALFPIGGVWDGGVPEARPPKGTPMISIQLSVSGFGVSSDFHGFVLESNWDCSRPRPHFDG